MFWPAGFTPEAGAVRRKRIAAAPASRRSLAPLDSGSIFKPKMLPYTGVTATCSPGDFKSVTHQYRSGFCVALACLALFPLPASAAPSVSEVTAKTQAAYKALNDFRAEFTHPAGGRSAYHEPLFGAQGHIAESCSVRTLPYQSGIKKFRAQGVKLRQSSLLWRGGRLVPTDVLDIPLPIGTGIGSHT